MLIPRRTKWRKQHRPHRTGFATGGTELAFGDYGIQALKPGRIMFELAGVPEALAREAMRRAQHKLPMKTRFVVREGGDN